MATGNVVRSTPAAKAKIEGESRVKLVVSTGPKQGDEDATPLEGQFLYTIRLGLDDLTEPTTVRIDIEDGDGVREIFEEERNTGDRIEASAIGKGKTATFLIKSVPATAGDTDVQ